MTAAEPKDIPPVAERVRQAEDGQRRFRGTLRDSKAEEHRIKSRLDWTRTQCAPGEAIQDTDLYRTALSGEGGELEKEQQGDG